MKLEKDKEMRFGKLWCAFQVIDRSFIYFFFF